MKALLIGYSRIGRRRVLPALKMVPGITSVAVASRSAKACEVDPELTFFEEYETAIERSGADLAYVSVRNADHARWAERALERGMHVIVDKPAFLGLDDARRMIDLASRRGCCLAEATVFGFHPQIEAAQRTFDEAGARPTRVTAVFSFPPLDSSDFRYCRDMGGGALFDVGPYVVASSRLFFGRRPERVSCQVLARRGEDRLDIAFSVLLTYPDGGALIGHFGFDTEYQNRLNLLGPRVAVDINRSFTLPPDQPTNLTVRRENVESEIAVPAADAFVIFLAKVLEVIAQGRWDPFFEMLLADAELLAGLRRASGEK